ncbi:MAG: SH3 domain-containing protein [Flavobacteriales bacterium]|nr:SH3 domain-containing protein [Flavobacteriales bacterium]
MKLSKIIIILSVLLFNIQIGLAQTGYINSNNGINLREGKGTHHKVITSIPSNEEVKILSKDGDWWKVKYNGNEGYVSAKYVTEHSNTETNHQSTTKKSNTSIATDELNWGIGIRLGDPSGISLKKYLNNSRSLELSVGRTSLLRNNKYYDKQFDNWYDNQKYGYKKFDYLGSKASTPLGVQVHYLFQQNLLEDDIEGLQWYYGFGGQVRYQTFVYDYRYKVNGDDNWYYSTENRVTNIDLGADGVVGLEYIIPNVPITVFADATLFMEIADNPFAFWFQGGIGGRYNF